MQASRSMSKKSFNSNGERVPSSGCNGSRKEKSMAQRVMDVTSGPSSKTKQVAGTTGAPPGFSGEELRQARSNNSVENDHEVETITNRLSKSDISPDGGPQTTSSSQNLINNSNQSKTSTTARAGSSSSLQIASPNTSSSNNKRQDPSTGARLSLDTRVPHPQSSLSGYQQQQVTTGRDEEVSYYNETLQPLQESACLLEPKQVGGSLDNNTKPRLLQLAASSALREQRLGSSACHMAIATSTASSGMLANKLAQEAQTSSPRAALSCQQLRHDNHQMAHKQQHQQHQRAPFQHGRNDPLPRPEVGFDMAHSHHYDDLTYDLRYDNALVIEKEAAAAAAAAAASATATPAGASTQKLHQRDTSAGGTSSRYQEIPDLTSEEQQQAEWQQEREASSDGRNQQRSDGCMSISTSPKAKSAPATPCNVTPTAFHQNVQHPSDFQNPNTLPPDIRKNLSTTCRVLPTSMGASRASGATGNRNNTTTGSAGLRHQQVSSKHLDGLIESAESALGEKNYMLAVELFSQCIHLASDNRDVSYLKRNFKIYAQRAEAHFHLRQYNEAIDDSMAARELNPKWSQAYYLQGRSQFMIGQYADSLAVFSFGLTQDPHNQMLFEALVEAALNSVTSFRREFKTKYNKLKSLHLDSQTFLVVSVLGQELLAKGHSEHAAIVLESALKLCASNNSQASSETQKPNRMFRSSILSTISLAYCSLHDYEKATCYMRKELDIEKELDDVPGQCRVLSNLGYTYYKVRKFEDSLKAHREQLNLALKSNLLHHASKALNAMGHVHSAKGDFSSALTSHMRCLDILKTLDKNEYNRFRELLALGHVQSQLNDLSAAEERFSEASEMLKLNHANKLVSHEQFGTGTIMVNFNLAYLALKRQTRDSFMKAKMHYTSVIEVAQTLYPSDTTNDNLYLTYEMRAYHGLGQTCRLLKDLEEARGWFEKQLRLAKRMNDLVGQSQALCNLGLVSQHHDQQHAWRLFDENLKLVAGNTQLEAYAHSYMGLANCLIGRVRESQNHYEMSLNLFKKLGYSTAEQRTIEDNIASIQRRAGQVDMVNSMPSIAGNLVQGSGPSNNKKVMLAS